MHHKPKEKDWKAFRSLVLKLRERYLETRNEELVMILGDEALSPTERFWKAEERAGDIAKVLRECLDGHSRSKMELFMSLMCGHGMMVKDDLTVFSEELQERMARRIDLM